MGDKQKGKGIKLPPDIFSYLIVDGRSNIMVTKN